MRFLHRCFPAGVLALARLTLAATCYDRSGNVQNPDWYKPCDNSTTFSACCLLRKEDGSLGDICTSAGLCLRQDGVPGFFYQDACTDPSWASSSCPHFCKESGQVVQSCQDTANGGTWCCRGIGEPSCCEGNNTFSTNVGVLLLPTVTVSISGTQTQTTIQTPTTDSSNTSASCSSPNPAVVGGAVGGVLGAALIAALAVLGWRERTRPKLGAAGIATGPAYAQTYAKAAYMDAAPPASTKYYEIGQNDSAELDGRQQR